MPKKKKGTRQNQRVGNNGGGNGAPVPPVVLPPDAPPPPDPDPDESTLSYEVYLSEREKLIDIESKSSDLHDKSVLQLTAAALGLSVTFMEKIAPHPAPYTLKYLFVAWTLLGLSIVFIVSSFLLSQMSCRRQRQLLDEEYTKQKIPKQINRASEWTIRTSFAGYVTFVSGIGLLLVFSAWNMSLLTTQGEADNFSEIGVQNAEQQTATPSSNRSTTDPETGPRQSVTGQTDDTTSSATQEVKEP
jgi:hypothetical protein